MVVGAPFVKLTMDLVVGRPVVAVALEGAAVQGCRRGGVHHRVGRAELCAGALALEEGHGDGRISGRAGTRPSIRRQEAKRRRKEEARPKQVIRRN